MVFGLRYNLVRRMLNIIIWLLVLHVLTVLISHFTLEILTIPKKK